MFIEYFVEPSSFIEVSINAILYLLRRISVEVVGLTLHWAQSRILEENPIVHFVLFSGALRIRDFVVLIVLFSEILEDAARFEKAYLLAIGERICNSWNTSIRVNFEEPRLFLDVLADVNVLDFVGLAELVSSGGFNHGVSSTY